MDGLAHTGSRTFGSPDMAMVRGPDSNPALELTAYSAQFLANPSVRYLWTSAQIVR